VFTRPPTRRFVTPCMNSWKTTSESKAVWRPVRVTGPMFISGGEPSTGVAMFAVPNTAPLCARASTGSPPRPPRPKFCSWKLPSGEHSSVVAASHRRRAVTQVREHRIADCPVVADPVLGEAGRRLERQRVGVRGEREIGQLPLVAVLAVDVAARHDRLHELTAEEDLARVRVDDRVVLAGVLGHGEDHGPSEAELSCQRQPDQARLDVGAEGAGRDDGRQLG
jgi:hypothetical protein